MKTFVILPAGGKGKRFGSNMPKQYIKINGKEILSYTVSVFDKCPMVNEIIIAAEPAYFELIGEITGGNNCSKKVNIVKGGNERQDSVFNALSSLSCSGDDLIIVHDAVRPLLPQNILQTAIEKAKIFDNVVVGIKARDTLIEFDGSENLFVSKYVERSNIYYAQTPQIFRYSVLLDSMKKAQKEGFIGTDESMLVKRAGYKVKIVEGSPLNFKITTGDDLKLFDMAIRFSNFTL